MTIERWAWQQDAHDRLLDAAHDGLPWGDEQEADYQASQIDRAMDDLKARGEPLLQLPPEPQP